MHVKAIVMIAVSSMALAANAADTRSVQADFDRCTSVMERVERSIRRYEDELAALKRTISRAASAKKETLAQDLLALENRLEYFRNRFERSRGQADKIRDDLKTSGPTCPSCIESSVNLYCRSGETLQTDIDEYLGRAADMRARIGMKADMPAASEEPKGFEFRREAAGALYHTLEDRKEACADRAAATLLEQARINLDRADSLHTADDRAGAEKALDISRSLLDKAAIRCGNGK